MSSTAPQKKKKYISTTNHQGGALHSSYYQLRRAHFGHPYTCTAPLPITTGALQIPLFGLPLILTYLPTTNHHGGATNTILWTSLILTYLPTTKHHGGATKTHSLDTPHPLPISTYAHSLDTLILTHYQSPRTTPAMVALPLSACLGACLGCRRAWWHPDKIPPRLVESPRATMAGV